MTGLLLTNENGVSDRNSCVLPDRTGGEPWQRMIAWSVLRDEEIVRNWRPNVESVEHLGLQKNGTRMIEWCVLTLDNLPDHAGACRQQWPHTRMQHWQRMRSRRSLLWADDQPANNLAIPWAEADGWGHASRYPRQRMLIPGLMLWLNEDGLSDLPATAKSDGRRNTSRHPRQRMIRQFLSKYKHADRSAVEGEPWIR